MQPEENIEDISNKAKQPVASPLDNLSVTGFSVLCAWHFLIVFSSMPRMGDDALEGRPLAFQIALYLSLAFSYLMLMLISKRFTGRLFGKDARASRRADMAFGTTASLATLFVVMAQGTFFYLELASWILVGLSESMLMFSWMKLPPAQRGKAGTPQNSAFNMGIGGVIAFIIGNLVLPYNYIALCLLPLLGALSIAASWETGDRVSAQEYDSEMARPLEHMGKQVAENGHFILYGLAFGICQCLFSAASGNADSVSYVVNSSWPMLGAVLSGLLVLATHLRLSPSNGAILMRHLSSLIFMMGIITSFYFVSSLTELEARAALVGDTVGQILCFAGFNIFDFGILIFAISWPERLKLSVIDFIAINRIVLYLSMACGLALGFLYDMFVASCLPNHISAVIGAVVVLLAAGAFPYFDKMAMVQPEAIDTGSNEHIEASEERPLTMQEKCLEQIADEHQLSKREREVFTFLAQGMNANEIQQKLWISIHTVKTHMSNVYRKLGVHSAHELVELVEANRSADDKEPTRGGGTSAASDADEERR